MKTHRVLLVEDDPDFVELLATFLRRAGWLPLVACNGTEAEVLARLSHPDLILCDEDVAGSTGSELIRRFKANPAMLGIPAILMSAYDAAIAATTAAEGLLEKPFTMDDLLAKVELISAGATRRVFGSVGNPSDGAMAWGDPGRSRQESIISRATPPH